MKKNATVFLQYDEIIHETDYAYYLLFEPGVQKWIAKNLSTLHNDGTIEVEGWWVEINEVEEYIV